MTNIFQRLRNTIRNRRQMNAELDRNSLKLKTTIDTIEREYAKESAALMDQFVKDLAEAGGIDCEKSETITEEADRKANIAQMRAQKKIAQATEEANRRAQQIIMRYQS